MKIGIKHLKIYIARYNRKRRRVIADNLDNAIVEAKRIFNTKPTEIYLMENVL